MPDTLELASPETDVLRQQLSELFAPMMRTLHEKAGAQFSVEILAEDKVQDFIGAHAKILDSAFERTPMSDLMRQRLQQSDYIFSGIKTFHELNEAFPSLVDESGNRKPFEQFLNDVRKIDSTYNKNYLRAEYNFVQSSADMAGKWERFEQDGDRYNLQYRTAGDSKVRPEHAALNGVTLPPSDPFWQTYYPPNGWNCRCTVVQVRKTKYPVTPHEDAMKRGAEATGKDTRGIFQFNAGQQQKTMPDYNPYTIKRCRDCDIAKGKVNLAFVPSNMLCDGCRFIHECYEDRAKSESKVLKTHYMHQMEPLLAVKKAMPTREREKTIKVGFSKIGNEHLYSDTFGRSKVLRKEDLKSLDLLLAQSPYIDDKVLTEVHPYDIVQFYYYEAELHGRKIRLNVAKERWKNKKGKIRTKYYLYSINDIKE